LYVLDKGQAFLIKKGSQSNKYKNKE